LVRTIKVIGTLCKYNNKVTVGGETMIFCLQMTIVTIKKKNERKVIIGLGAKHKIVNTK